MRHIDSPIVFESVGDSERGYDIYSRLLKDRIVFLNGDIEEDLANSIIAQLIYLDSQDSDNTIKLYINSPGGSVTDGMAIYDTMRFIKSKIHTICVGQACSMAAILLSSGDKRFALPNAEIMIHQVSSGTEGQASDIFIHTDLLKKTKDKLDELLSFHTKQSLKKIKRDTNRNYWMTAQEAKEYGLIDKIIVSKK